MQIIQKLKYKKYKISIKKDGYYISFKQTTLGPYVYITNTIELFGDIEKRGIQKIPKDYKNENTEVFLGNEDIFLGFSKRKNIKNDDIKLLDIINIKSTTTQKILLDNVNLIYNFKENDKEFLLVNYFLKGENKTQIFDINTLDIVKNEIDSIKDVKLNYFKKDNLFYKLKYNGEIYKYKLNTSFYFVLEQIDEYDYDKGKIDEEFYEFFNMQFQIEKDKAIEYYKNNPNVQKTNDLTTFIDFCIYTIITLLSVSYLIYLIPLGNTANILIFFGFIIGVLFVNNFLLPIIKPIFKNIGLLSIIVILFLLTAIYSSFVFTLIGGFFIYKLYKFNRKYDFNGNIKIPQNFHLDKFMNIVDIKKVDYKNDTRKAIDNLRSGIIIGNATISLTIMFAIGFKFQIFIENIALFLHNYLGGFGTFLYIILFIGTVIGFLFLGYKIIYYSIYFFIISFKYPFVLKDKTSKFLGLSKITHKNITNYITLKDREYYKDFDFVRHRIGDYQKIENEDNNTILKRNNDILYIKQ